MAKTKIGIFGLTGCGGDQLAILNCEDELLNIVSALDLRDFIMASSANDSVCNLDVALVEGAIVTHEDESQIRRVRSRVSIHGIGRRIIFLSPGSSPSSGPVQPSTRAWISSSSVSRSGRFSREPVCRRP
jgi:hypothetical protein